MVTVTKGHRRGGLTPGTVSYSADGRSFGVMLGLSRPTPEPIYPTSRVCQEAATPEPTSLTRYLKLTRAIPWTINSCRRSRPESWMRLWTLAYTVRTLDQLLIYITSGRRVPRDVLCNLSFLF